MSSHPGTHRPKMPLMKALLVVLRQVAEVHNGSHPAVDHEVTLASRMHHELWLGWWREMSLVAGTFWRVMSLFDVLDCVLLEMRVHLEVRMLLLLHMCDVQHTRVARYHGTMRHNLFSVHYSNRPGSEPAKACWRNSSAEPPHRSHLEVPLKLRAFANDDALPRTGIGLNVSTRW